MAKFFEESGYKLQTSDEFIFSRKEKIYNLVQNIVHGKLNPQIVTIIKEMSSLSTYIMNYMRNIEHCIVDENLTNFFNETGLFVMREELGFMYRILLRSIVLHKHQDDGVVPNEQEDKELKRLLEHFTSFLYFEDFLSLDDVPENVRRNLAAYFVLMEVDRNVGFVERAFQDVNDSMTNHSEGKFKDLYTNLKNLLYVSYDFLGDMVRDHILSEFSFCDLTNVLYEDICSEGAKLALFKIKRKLYTWMLDNCPRNADLMALLVRAHGLRKSEGDYQNLMNEIATMMDMYANDLPATSSGNPEMFQELMRLIFEDFMQ